MPRTTRSIVVSIVVLTMTILLAYFAGQAVARPGQVQPQPILRPVGLHEAKRLCANETPKVECRAQLRRVIAALAWQKHTRKHLERRLATLTTPLPRLASWTCIHQHEGAWNDTTDPYWGGLQMDKTFMRTYGADMIKKYGGWADQWTPRDQIIVAERAYQTRGFNPWPNTAHACGLL